MIKSSKRQSANQQVGAPTATKGSNRNFQDGNKIAHVLYLDHSASVNIDNQKERSADAGDFISECKEIAKTNLLRLYD